MPLDVTPRTPIEYEAVKALLGMMRGVEASTGAPDAVYELDVIRRNVRRSHRLRGGESTAMPAGEWANLIANR